MLYLTGIDLVTAINAAVLGFGGIAVDVVILSGDVDSASATSAAVQAAKAPPPV